MPILSSMSQKLLLTLVFTLLFCGCVCDEKHFGLPNLLHPGHIDEQRSRMERFDPFPQVGMGPSVEGGRFHGADRPKQPTGYLLNNYQRGYK